MRSYRCLLVLFTLLFLISLVSNSFAQGQRVKDGHMLKETKLNIPCQDKFVDVDGRKLNCKIYGKGGPTIVLISGFNDPMWNWNPIVPELAKTSTVVTYDRPGYGKSELGDAPNHAKRAAQDLHNLLEKLDVPKPYVMVGHSYGCRVTRLYCSQYPQNIGGILLEDGSHESVLDAQREVLTGEDLEKLEQMASMMNTPENPKSETDYMEISFEQIKNCGPLPQVPFTVLTAGDRSRAMPPIFSEEGKKKLIKVGIDLQKKLVSIIPGGKHLIVENSGHVIHNEKPDVVISEITEIVNNIRKN